ncbi:helix-turn-helix transcriptional regulator [Phenylobacterium sp.]|jgi:XRE family aerobic/anaerobic benzoate catabolism transcriptional regulator|uniref:helix-turn-helix transcriptional regulator n=1 Tax=Phenylobacterium sp. TaxID=1871053 RepID=UPI0037850B61
MTETAPPAAADSSAVTEEAYLALLGERVREIRARRGMTRKILARDSGVSERYLAQLESGQGNISILLLRQLAEALDTPLPALVVDGPEPAIEFVHAVELLRRLPEDGLQEAHALLVDKFGGIGAGDRRSRIALIGLRGAGKSTLGRLLAERLACPFVELDKEIEGEAGAPLNAIFDLYGQPAFRRLERRCLERVIEENPRAVIATGGGLVSDPATFERLLAGCYTVWVKATPAEHMARVIAQGDMRPMSDNREAMADLQRILRTRDPLYRRADAQVDTSRRSLDESLEDLTAAIR